MNGKWWKHHREAFLSALLGFGITTVVFALKILSGA